MENLFGILVELVHKNEKMRLDNSGRLGIGTASPSQMLTVRGTILKTRSDHGTGLIYLQNDGSQNGNIVINQNGGVTRVKLNSAGDSYLMVVNYLSIQLPHQLLILNFLYLVMVE